MECKTCSKCEARWLDGQLFWRTGKPGSELDLAGLVCNKYGNDQCINPAKGKEGGTTWEDRLAVLDKMEEELQKRLQG